VSVPEVGEFRVGEVRGLFLWRKNISFVDLKVFLIIIVVVAMRAADLGSSFILAAQALAVAPIVETKEKPKRPKGSSANISLKGKISVDSLIQASKIAQGLLYGYGISIGEQFASNFLESDPSKLVKTAPVPKAWSDCMTGELIVDFFVFFFVIFFFDFRT
jgi:hypothetical protein